MTGVEPSTLDVLDVERLLNGSSPLEPNSFRGIETPVIIKREIRNTEIMRIAHTSNNRGAADREFVDIEFS